MADSEGSERRVYESPPALAQAVAEWLCGLAMASDGDFSVCLSGGSTPRLMYQRLVEPSIAARFPWGRVHWFWGDERFVPHDSADSSSRMARDAFLSRVPAPRENIHPIPTEGLSPGQSADAYESTLRQFYGADAIDPDRPIFGVTFLGIGQNGHTASLFPGDAALKEIRRWVLPVIDTAREARITLTYPALDSSLRVAFLATGRDKAAMVARAEAGDAAVPAGRVRPVGRCHWFIDRAAATKSG